jgi:hypothetical protein
VARIASKAIESALYELIFLRISLGIARRCAYNSDFIIQKYTMIEGIFTVSLTKRTMLFDSKTDKKMKGVLAQNRGKAIALTPDSVLMIA